MPGTRFGARTLARSQALQLLFQAEMTGQLVSDVLEGSYALERGPLDPYAADLALGVDGMIHELDNVMAMTSANWSVSRMPAVDRNLLRIALYEMLCVDEVDVAVAIDECVELARAYGTDDSFRFVNGVLGKVARRMEAGEDVLAVADAIAAQEEAAAQDDAEDESQGEPATDEDEVPEDEVPAWAKE